MFVVLDGDEPVGFLQCWREADPPVRGGLDGFLIPSARGLGLMPRAARALAQSLLDEGWASVTVDPYEWNEQALRGWANAGLRRGLPRASGGRAPHRAVGVDAVSWVI